MNSTKRWWLMSGGLFHDCQQVWVATYWCSSEKYFVGVFNDSGTRWRLGVAVCASLIVKHWGIDRGLVGGRHCVESRRFTSCSIPLFIFRFYTHDCIHKILIGWCSLHTNPRYSSITSGFTYLTFNFWWKGQEFALCQSNLWIHCSWVDVGGDLRVVDRCWCPVCDFWFFNWQRLWFRGNIVWSQRTICCIFSFHKRMSRQLIDIISNFFSNRHFWLLGSGWRLGHLALWRCFFSCFWFMRLLCSCVNALLLERA